MLKNKNVLYFGGFFLLIVAAGVTGYIMRTRGACPAPGQPQEPAGQSAPAGAMNGMSKYEQAVQHVTNNEPEKAIALLKADIDSGQESDPILITKLAECYLFLKNFTEAERYLQEAEKRSTKVSFIYRTYAQMYAMKKDFARAKKSLDYSLEIAESDNERLFGYIGLAQLALDQKNIASAKENIKKALKIDPNYTFANVVNEMIVAAEKGQ